MVSELLIRAEVDDTGKLLSPPSAITQQYEEGRGKRTEMIFEKMDLTCVQFDWRL